MSENPMEHTEAAADEQPQASGDGAGRLVPVGESIKYRRRAQQAEGRVQQLEQQLNDLTAQLEGRCDQLASAEAQRDEAMHRLVEMENRLSAERLLTASGAVDTEAALVLLGKRLDLAEELDHQAIADGVEQLLLDKPFLRARPGGLPPGTAAARPRAAATAQLAQAAQQAARTGDRRDVAEYLRLRRSTANRKL